MVSSVYMSTKHVNDIKNYYISGGQRYSERGYSEYRDLLSVAFQRNPTAFWVFIKHYVAKICTVSAKNNGGPSNFGVIWTQTYLCDLTVCAHHIPNAAIMLHSVCSESAGGIPVTFEKRWPGDGVKMNYM